MMDMVGRVEARAAAASTTLLLLGEDVLYGPLLDWSTLARRILDKLAVMSGGSLEDGGMTPHSWQRGVGCVSFS